MTIFLCLALLPGIALSQQVGVTRVPTDATKFDGVGFINLNSGNLHREIPLRTALDRIGRTTTRNLFYDSEAFVEVQVSTEQGNPPSTFPAWAALLSYNRQFEVRDYANPFPSVFSSTFVSSGRLPTAT